MAVTEQQHKVLVIAYYFPPLGLSGVQRTFKFVKYLSSFGWAPTVLTVEERGYFAKDDSFLQELEGLPVEVIRTPSLDPWYFLRKKDIVAMPSGPTHNLLSKLSQFFIIPDNKIGWKKYALAQARKLLSEQKFDAIFATAPPYTDFLIARELKKEFNLPLVIDYRDSWLENPLHTYFTPFHRMRHRRLEASVLRYADHVVTINRRIKESIVRSYDFFQHSDISIISQGYDAEDFGNKDQSRKTKFRITHSGTFYYNRTPKYFLHALRGFIDEHPEVKNDIEACFIGIWRDADTALISKLGLEEQVRITGYLQHKECVSLLEHSDVLWMIIGNGRGEEMMSTGKLYEYFGAKKPILACVPDGMAKQILDKSNVAYITEPDNIEDIKAHLSTLYQLYKNGRLPSPSDQFVQQFERRSLTAELARILARVKHLGPLESRVLKEEA